MLRPATLFAPACNPTCPALHPHQERVDSLTFIRSPYWLRNNLGLDVAVTVEGQGGGGAGSGHGREPAAVPQGETRELKVGAEPQLEAPHMHHDMHLGGVGSGPEHGRSGAASSLRGRRLFPQAAGSTDGERGRELVPATQHALERQPLL